MVNYSISLEWNQKLVGFCRTSDFSFPNFGGVGMNRILMLIYQIPFGVKKNTVR